MLKSGQHGHVEDRPSGARVNGYFVDLTHHHQASLIAKTDTGTQPVNPTMIVDGPHFQATDEGELVFLLTDGDDSRRPTEHDIVEVDEESALRDNYYLRIPLEHPDSHRWRAEIAKYLAPLMLGGKLSRVHCVAVE